MIIIGSIVFGVAYLIGALPTGYWLAWYGFGVDITKHGSGNIGATNIGRILGKQAFFLVFCIDAGKALGTLALIQSLCNDQILLYGTSAVLLIGNACSPFLGWRGGKGVATSFGIIAFFLPWIMTMSAMFIWIVLLVIFQQAFFASLISFFLLFNVSLYNNLYHNMVNQSTLLGYILLWLVIRHRSNIVFFFKRRWRLGSNKK
jgi:glycerol-3-phosphate acyltransferase PlsY